MSDAGKSLQQENADSTELEALFDSIAAESAAGGSGAVAPVGEAPAPDAGGVYNRLGMLTRQLHNTLRELGYDKVLVASASAMPDARERLSYIAAKTEEAACRTLTAVETAQPIQETLQDQAETLKAAWDAVVAGRLPVAEFPALAHKTRDYLGAVPQQTGATLSQLTTIMMAQDFQDLTGQVIKKIVELAQRTETELLQLLLDAAPAEKRLEAQSGGLVNGPVIHPEGRSDVVASQAQVDDLLESLGF